MTTTLDTELLDRVRELRRSGRTPKQIARALGVRSATVAPLVRAVAQEAADAEPALVGCWVSPGWSVGLSVDGQEDWPDIDVLANGQEGVACLAVARRHRSHRVSVCGYLVDTFCLGVKNALGPKIMDEGELASFLGRYFAAFEEVGAPLPVSLELSRHLVWGAVDHARRLGFEPASDFEPTAGHLGAWQETSAITFGKDGVPYYVAGPYDNPARVLRTLRRTRGEGNFHFTAPVEAVAGW